MACAKQGRKIVFLAACWAINMLPWRSAWPTFLAKVAIAALAYAPLAWVILCMIFIIPFFVLLNRKIKIRKAPMVGLTVVILAGMWLERFVLVVPSLWHAGSIPIGPLEVLITAGFLGLTGLCLILFLQRVPVVPVSDPIFQKEISSGEDEEKLKP